MSLPDVSLERTPPQLKLKAKKLVSLRTGFFVVNYWRVRCLAWPPDCPCRTQGQAEQGTGSLSWRIVQGSELLGALDSCMHYWKFNLQGEAYEQERGYNKPGSDQL